MANGDSDGTRLRKQMLATRRDALVTALQNYVGNHNGRVDLVLQMNATVDEYNRIACST